MYAPALGVVVPEGAVEKIAQRRTARGHTSSHQAGTSVGDDPAVRTETDELGQRTVW
jgi:hypothetical protein